MRKVNSFMPLWLRTGLRRIVQWPFRSYKNFFISGTSTLAVIRWALGYITADEMLSVVGLLLKLFGLA